MIQQKLKDTKDMVILECQKEVKKQIDEKHMIQVDTKTILAYYLIKLILHHSL